MLQALAVLIVFETPPHFNVPPLFAEMTAVIFVWGLSDLSSLNTHPRFGTMFLTTSTGNQGIAYRRSSPFSALYDSAIAPRRTRPRLNWIEAQFQAMLTDPLRSDSAVIEVLKCDVRYYVWLHNVDSDDPFAFPARLRRWVRVSDWYVPTAFLLERPPKAPFAGDGSSALRRAQFVCRQGIEPGSPYPRPSYPRKKCARSAIIIQSEPSKSHKPRSTRAERDAAQSKHSAAERKRLWQAIPKRARKERVRLAREAKDFAHNNRYADVDIQSGAIKIALNTAFAIATAGLVRRIARLIDVSKEAADQVSKAFRRVGDTLQERFRGALWKVPLLILAFEVCRRHAGTTLVALTAAASLKLVGQPLWQHVEKYFHAFDTAAPSIQSGAISPIAALLASGLTFINLGGKGPAQVTTELIRRVGLIERSAQGWTALSAWFMSALEVSINFFRGLFGKAHIKLLKDSQQPLRDWIKHVDHVSTINMVGDDVDVKYVNTLVELIRRGYELRDIYRLTAVEKVIMDNLMRLNTIINPLLGSIQARNNFRVEPIMAMFVGKPGIGKTVVTLPIATTILALSKVLGPDATADEMIANVFQKGTSEFWNSYTGQAVVIQDDAFQNRPVPGAENDYTMVMKAIGSWAFPLNFADLASKGRYFFSSKFVLGTTNLKCIMSEAENVIIEPLAVVRRIKYAYELRLRPEYADANGRLDHNLKLQQIAACAENADPIDRFPWYMWTVAVHDFGTGNTLEQDRPLRDAVIDMANDLKVRIANHGIDLKTVRSYVNGIIEGPSIQGTLDTVQEDVLEFICDPGSKAASPECYVSYAKRIDDELSLWSTLAGYAKFLIVGFGAIIALRAVFSVAIAIIKETISAFTGKREPEMQSNRPETQRHAKQRKTQSCDTPDSSIRANIYSNSYKFRVETGSEVQSLGQIIFLEDTLVVQPLHFREQIERNLRSGECTRDTRIALINCVNPEHRFEMKVGTFLGLDHHIPLDSNGRTNDLEFVRYEDIRAHRNVARNILTEAQICSLRVCPQEVHIDVCRIHRNVHTRTDLSASKLAFKAGLHCSSRPEGRRMERCFEYNYGSGPWSAIGDCGASVTLSNCTNYKGKSFFGIHVAGDAKRPLGYCSILSAELYADAKVALRTITDNFVDDMAERGCPVTEVDSGPFIQNGSFMPIGVVDRAVNICPKTAYQQTPYGRSELVGPHPYKPTHLSPFKNDEGELVRPMLNALRPYSTPVLTYNKSPIQQAVYIANKRFEEATAKTVARVFTFEEAVLGNSEYKFRSIPRDTGAGYPYVLDRLDGKKSFFGTGEHYDLTGAKCGDLRTRVAHVIDAAKRNERLSHVFMDFLKDELRSWAKVDAGATRLISASPLDYALCIRMYFGHYTAEVMHHNVGTGYGPGVCVYTDADRMFNHLTSLGPDVFAGDFRLFDSSEMPLFLWELLHSINRWYRKRGGTEEDDRVRTVLFLELVHSRHIGGEGFNQRFIYQWSKSLPSGHPLTTIINSMYSLTLLVLGYMYCTGDLTNFWLNVAPLVYGDDNVANTHPDVTPKFNQVTMASVMAKHFGLTYTADRKDAGLATGTGIFDVTFLKRSFRLESDFVLMPLDKDSFLYTFYWVRNPRLYKKIMGDNFETALEELSMHESDLWAKYATTLRTALEELRVPQCPHSRGAYQDVIRTRADHWF